MKFKKGYDSNDLSKNDLTQIEIALTDFGMADADSKGGTPVFASPECFEETETKSAGNMMEAWKGYEGNAKDT